MPDATAWILVGPQSGGYGSHHFDPTHLLELTENDRAAWRLLPLGQAGTEPTITWVPASPATLVHDAMLLMAIQVFKDPDVTATASQAIPDISNERVDLNLPDRSPQLGSLYELCRSLRGARLVVTVLSQSSLARSVGDFRDYESPARICVEQ